MMIFSLRIQKALIWSMVALLALSVFPLQNVFAQTATSTPSTTVPGKPTGFSTGEYTSDSMRLSWDTISGLTYSIKYKKTPFTTWDDAATAVTATASPYTLSGLHERTTYYVAIRACNSNNECSPYDERSAVTATAQSTTTACSDGVDNDGDGKIDLSDPGCADANDNDETDQTTAPKACSDGIDNDGDGKTDYPSDDGCYGPDDSDEYIPQYGDCQNNTTQSSCTAQPGCKWFPPDANYTQSFCQGDNYVPPSEQPSTGEQTFYCDALHKNLPSTDAGYTECERVREEERFRREEEDRLRRDEENRRRLEDDERRQQEEEERRQHEEERRQQEEERHFQQWKRDLQQFTREIDRMEREIERMKKRLSRCELSIPSSVNDLIAKARAVAAKIHTATTFEELEDVQFEIEDVAFEMHDWGPQTGALQQICEMLSNADREIQRLEKDAGRMERDAQREKVGNTLIFAKLRELRKKMKSALEDARKQAKEDPEQAVLTLEDEFFFKMEDYHNAERGFFMMLHLAEGLRDADREIKEFAQRIDALKDEGKETGKMEALLDELRAVKAELEAMVKKGVSDPSDVEDLIEYAFDIREDLISRLGHRERGRKGFFEGDEEGDFGDAFGEEGESDFELPEGFQVSAKRRVILKEEKKGRKADEQIQGIVAKAELLMQGKLDAILTELQVLRDTVQEQAAELKFLKKLSGDLEKINEEMRERINAFVTYGVDENSKKLGAGERAAVVHSFEAAFGALPESDQDVEDMVKIVNGRFPSQRSPVAEKQARKTFREIYKRVANLNDDHDAAAIMIMAYGLRQTAKNRNLDSEKQGITTFRAIFKKVPQTTDEWNTMQAITYSGATRKPDTDKDGLADDDEAVFGTDPAKADTDGDGIPDGTEIDEGFDPLEE